MLTFIEKYRTYIGIFLILLILIGGGILLWNAKKGGQSNLVKNEIRIDIEGAVKNPGIYQFKSGAIIEDAIKAAGGLAEQVYKDKLASQINRVEVLRDGQKILIPIKSSVAGAQANQSVQQSSDVIAGKININTATAEELDSLPDIGPAYAQKIIDYREEHGGFESIEDIQNVAGIGPKTFEKLKDLITV